MREILARITRVHGVRGCMLLDQEGLIVAEDLRADVSADAVGAAASEVLRNLANAAGRLDFGEIRRFTLTGRDARCAAVPVGKTLLLVLIEPNANQAMVWVEITEAAKELAKKLPPA
jgi:predicted regulator of Ras-like GTPase activity (Roadblock/LC7/MglB family)